MHVQRVKLTEKLNLKREKIHEYKLGTNFGYETQEMGI